MEMPLNSWLNLVISVPEWEGLPMPSCPVKIGFSSIAMGVSEYNNPARVSCDKFRIYVVVDQPGKEQAGCVGIRLV